MEYAQLESRVSFLDNQYRREREEMAQLRRRLDVSEAEKEELLKRIAALEEALTGVRAELPKIDLLDSRTERFKSEMLNALQDQKERQRQALKDAERSRAIEMEVQTKAINEIRREVTQGHNLEELITLARAEIDRQAASLTATRQKLDEFIHETDEHIHTLNYLEEQRRIESKRLTDMQSDLSDLGNKADAQLSKVELLEKQIPQFGQFQRALQEIRESVRAEVDRVQYQQAQVDRHLKQWDDLAESVQHRLSDFGSRLERYAEHYQRNVKALEALQAFQEKLQRDQHEFTELQRLNNDRFRSQIEEWQSIQSQTFKKHIQETNQALGEMERRLAGLDESIDSASDQIAPLQDQFTLLLRIIEEDALARAMAARDWQQRFEQLATEEGV